MSSKVKVLLCTNKHCRKRGSKELLCAFEEELESLGLAHRFNIKKSDCLEHCKRGPVMKVKGLNITYLRVQTSDCRDIIKALLEARQVIESSLHKK